MKTIVFAGGGTAGHIMPNLAIIDRLKNKYSCVYVGGDGMEKTLCAERGIPFFEIKTVKLRRDSIVRNLAVPFKLSACVRSARSVFKTVRPDLVFSKGGYAALPAVLAAGHIPVLCHESDITAGMTTKLSARKSKAVLCAFSDCAASLKKGVYVGAPLRADLLGGVRDKRAYGLCSNRPTLAVVGGSSGAASLNATVISALPELNKMFDVIHVTGKNKTGAAKTDRYCPCEFESDMPRLYATADVIVTRAGANALAECAAVGLPTLAVPLEKASRGDQLLNARYYERRGKARVLRECDISRPADLTSAVVALYNSRALFTRDDADISAVDKIVSIIDGVLSEKN